MKATRLQKITLSITSEAEDAVVEMLHTLFPNPASVYQDMETGETTATVYCENKSDWSMAKKKALQQGLARIRECGIDTGSASLTVQSIRKEDWAESWKRHFKPLEIGRALLVRPSWVKRRLKKGQSEIVLDPGLSFGTGHHATTSFCLNSLVVARNTGQPQSFLDIGTGSGILSIAAAKLGYDPIEAFDFDPEAVRVAKINAKSNRVDGKIKIVRRDLTKTSPKGRRYSVVAANLIFDLLIAERDRILNRVQPDGTLILAGILQTQFKRVDAVYRQAGWKLVDSRVEKEWQSGMFLRL